MQYQNYKVPSKKELDFHSPIPLFFIANSDIFG